MKNNNINISDKYKNYTEKQICYSSFEDWLTMYRKCFEANQYN